MGNLSSTQQLLVATAWADGRLDPGEAEFLRRVLANGSVSVEQIESCLHSPTVNLDEVLAQFSEMQVGEEVMREVLRMCFIDEVLELTELDLIERLAGRLGLDSERLEALRLEVTGAAT